MLDSPASNTLIVVPYAIPDMNADLMGIRGNSSEYRERYGYYYSHTFVGVSEDLRIGVLRARWLMNWDQMKKNVGVRVRLVPPACRLDSQGRKLPAIDDEWIIEKVAGDVVRIRNARTGHTAKLGKDHIYRYTSNPNQSQGGVQSGFLTLNVQIFMGVDLLYVRPNARPGEAVEPPTQTVLQKLGRY